MPSSTIKTGLMRRDYEIRKDDVNQEARTVALTFSSEEPYERWFGVEVLDHGKKSVMLDRLNAGGPLLVGHNPEDHVGVVEEARIGSDRRGRAVVRLGKSARAEEIFRDVQDGIRRNVSVGYRVHQMVLEATDKTDAGEINTYRVTRWEPLEISLVSVPADNTVGVGRSDDATREYDTEVLQLETITTRAAEPPKETVMTEKIVEQVVDLAVERDKARKEEQKRVREIMAYGEQFNCRDEAKKAIEDGLATDAFRAQVLERLGKIRPVETSADIGMTEKEVRRFSFTRAILAQAAGNPELAAFERECSAAAAKQLGKQPRGIFVPNDVLKRDVNVTTDSQGGHLVGTNLLGQDFISLLTNKMVIAQLGTRILSGLVGDVAIPGALTGATSYWVSESTNITTESTPTFRQVALTPKTLGSYVDISRKLLLQSSIDVEMYIRNLIALSVALEIDRAAINGSGSTPEPRGILNVVGIGAVAGGTNGKAPTYANIVALESEVAIDNADVGSLAYLTNAKVRGKLRTTFTNATYGEIPVWTNGPDGMGMVNGYRAAVSNQVPSTLVKASSGAVCSAIIFGNFADLVIGQWGALDILVDPITGGLQGTVRVIGLEDVDIAVRNAVSFSSMQDALTS